MKSQVVELFKHKIIIQAQKYIKKKNRSNGDVPVDMA